MSPLVRRLLYISDFFSAMINTTPPYPASKSLPLIWMEVTLSFGSSRIWIGARNCDLFVECKNKKSKQSKISKKHTEALWILLNKHLPAIPETNRSIV